MQTITWCNGRHQWGSDLCFSVGGKMFLVTGLEQSPITASFKVTGEQFEELSAKPGFKPAPSQTQNLWRDIRRRKMTY